MNLSQLSETQKKRIETAVENLTFGKLLGIHLEAAEPGFASMSLEIRDQLKQNNRVVHGGAIAALIDSAAAFAVIPLLEEGETATTVDLTISYLSPLQFGVAKASARVLRQGSRIIVLSADVFDEAGNIAATALTSYLRLKKRAEIPVDS
jgi:acyl-CoA thioesterase